MPTLLGVGTFVASFMPVVWRIVLAPDSIRLAILFT